MAELRHDLKESIEREMVHGQDWLAGDDYDRAYRSDELELRRHTFLRGMPGYRDKMFNIGGTALARLSEPQEAGSGWQVTIIAMQAGLFPPISLITTFAPPANVPGLSLPRATVRAASGPNVGPPKLRIEYGTGNNFETAWMDYPVQGGTFEVYATDVRVFLEQPPTFGGGSGPNYDPNPFVGAFITKGTRSKDLLLPTYTQSVIAVSTSGPGAFFVPPRAIGYRVITNTGTPFDYGLTGPTNILVPQTAGALTLARGAGVLQGVVVTVVGTSNLTFTDVTTGNVIATVPSTATVGQYFLFNSGWGGPTVNGALLQANKSATTPQVTATVAPWPGQQSTIFHSLSQCLYDGTIVQRDSVQVSPWLEAGFQASAQGNLWAPLHPATQLVLVTPNDPSQADLAGVQFLLDLG